MTEKAVLQNLSTYHDTYGAKNGFDIRSIIDDAISYMLLFTATEQEQISHLYASIKLGKVFFDRFEADFSKHSQTPEMLAHFMVISGSITELMRAAPPFEDVLTPIYEPLLVQEKGQFMTPRSLARGAAKLLDKNDAKTLMESACGTGSLALAQLETTYQKLGAEALVKQTLVLNDIDIRLVKIAVFQVMFHSIHHESPIGEIRAFASDFIKDYDEAKPIFLEAISTRRSVEQMLAVR